MTLAEDLEEDVGAGLGKRHIAEFVDDQQFDGGELRLQFEETAFVAGFHQLMNEPGSCEEGDRDAALASGEAERQTDMRLAGAGVSESDDVLAGDEIFAAREFENERLVERWNGGKVERVETLHRREMRGADTPLDHAPFAIDEFELGETQKEADMIKTFARGLRGDFFIFAQEGRQLELSCPPRDWRS